MLGPTGGVEDQEVVDLQNLGRADQDRSRPGLRRQQRGQAAGDQRTPTSGPGQAAGAGRSGPRQDRRPQRPRGRPPPLPGGLEPAGRPQGASDAHGACSGPSEPCLGGWTWELALVSTLGAACPAGCAPPGQQPGLRSRCRKAPCLARAPEHGESWSARFTRSNYEVPSGSGGLSCPGCGASAGARVRGRNAAARSPRRPTAASTIIASP
jgi:hypothetical protein